MRQASLANAAAQAVNRRQRDDFDAFPGTAMQWHPRCVDPASRRSGVCCCIGSYCLLVFGAAGSASSEYAAYVSATRKGTSVSPSCLTCQFRLLASHVLVGLVCGSRQLRAGLRRDGAESVGNQPHAPGSTARRRRLPDRTAARARRSTRTTARHFCRRRGQSALSTASRDDIVLSSRSDQAAVSGVVWSARAARCCACCHCHCHDLVATVWR